MVATSHGCSESFCLAITVSPSSPDAATVTGDVLRHQTPAGLSNEARNTQNLPQRWAFMKPKMLLGVCCTQIWSISSWAGLGCWVTLQRCWMVGTWWLPCCLVPLIAGIQTAVCLEPNLCHFELFLEGNKPHGLIRVIAAGLS